MKLAQETETFANEKLSWLGSAHGTDMGRTVTLDVSLFHADFLAQGFVPSGVALAKITASGKYGPYNDAAVDGRAAMVGHLLATVGINAANTPDVDVAGALLDHGRVVEAKLPTNHGLDAAGKADTAGRLIYA